MNRNTAIKLGLSSITAALLLSACSSTPPAPEPAKVEERAVAPSQPIRAPEVAPVSSDTNTGKSRYAELNDPKSILAKRSVYFDYDSFIVKSEDRPLLEAHAAFIKKHADVKVLIQGNADERGSREYNLALGQKRSDAVKSTLKLLGIKEEQLESVSLGEEKPRCEASTEECWAQNRRGDILYTGEF